MTDHAPHILLATATSAFALAAPTVAQGALVADCSLAHWLPVSARMLATTLLRFMLEIAELIKLVG